MLDETRKMRDFCRNAKPYSGLIEMDNGKRRAFARELAGQPMKAPAWRKDGVYPVDDWVFANHSFWHCVVNFCYLDPENPKVQFQAGPFSGAEGMYHCFTRKFDGKMIGYEEIMRIADTPEHLAEFFQGSVPIPMLEERRQNLLEAATVLDLCYNNDPEKILSRCGYTAERVVRELIESFPKSFGADHVETPEGRFTFAKRANLWSMVYQGRAVDSQDLPNLTGCDDIAPVCDYQLPNGFRWHGLHRYAPELAQKIDGKIPLARHSREERAIRFATYETILDLTDEINHYRSADLPPVTMVELDPLCWYEGREAYQNGMMHMLVKTTDY